MSRFNSNFDSDLETVYVASRLPQLWVLTRGLLFLSAPMFFILGFHDNLVDPGAWARTWPIRLATALTYLVIVALTWRWTSLAQLRVTSGLGFMATTVGLGLVVAQIGTGPIPVDGYYTHAPGFILGLGLIALAINFGSATQTVLILFFTPIAMYLITGASTTETLSLTIFLTTGVLFSFAGFLRADSTNRRVFIVERELEDERDKVDELVRRMVPGPIADRLKQGEDQISDHHPDVTVLFADIVGFTRFSEQNEPARVVDLLNELFTRFDHLVTDLGLTKIKTIGDGYMVAGGVPEPMNDHAERIVELAIQLKHEVGRFDADNDLDWDIRIGINSGPVVAGLIGSERYAYDLWGDTVNVASRLETTGDAGQIRISAETAGRVNGSVDLTSLGRIEMKNREPVEAFSVDDPSSVETMQHHPRG